MQFFDSHVSGYTEKIVALIPPLLRKCNIAISTIAYDTHDLYLPFAGPMSWRRIFFASDILP